jgi:HAD superfamily hydrolase (TIGR01509 family)
MVVTDAVVFDLDGVLIESEQLWDEARRELVSEHGGRWDDEATSAMQGMSSPEWAAYLHDRLGVPLPADRIVDLVLEKLFARYEKGLPLLPGALDAVRRMASRWTLGLASSSNRVVIERVLDLSGLRSEFAATVSSEEVAAGKPAPDVYLAAAQLLGCSPVACLAVEDSANGIRAAAAAGLRVIAVPNRAYPPSPDALALAAVQLDGLDSLTVAAVEALDDRTDDRLDEEEVQSFPASDPHSDWAGPPR